MDWVQVIYRHYLVRYNTFRILICYMDDVIKYVINLFNY